MSSTTAKRRGSLAGAARHLPPEARARLKAMQEQAPPLAALLVRLGTLQARQAAGDDRTEGWAELRSDLALHGYVLPPGTGPEQPDQPQPGGGCDWRQWPGTADWPVPPQISQDALAAVHDVYLKVAEDATADPERRAQAIKAVGKMRVYANEWVGYAGLG